MVDLVFAEDRGEPVDPDGLTGSSAKPCRPRAAPGRRRRRPRLRRRDEQDRLRHLHPPPAERVRDRRRASRDPGRPRRVPAFRDRLAQQGGSARYLRPICRGPITYEHREPLQRDLAHLKAAIDGQPVTGAFMNAPSPGVIALFQPNEHYATLDEYLEAIGEAMKMEYEAIVAAGVQLQIDAPDLAMGRHIMYRDRPDEEFVAAVERHVGRSKRPARLPADRVRMHLCWGNYEGPHHLDIGLEKIIDAGPARQAVDDPVRGRQPPPRARVGGVARGADPRGQGPRARRDRLDHQLHRASRAGGAAARALHRHRRRRAGHRRHRLRLRDLVGFRGRSTPISAGPSWARWPTVPGSPPGAPGPAPPDLAAARAPVASVSGRGRPRPP